MNSYIEDWFRFCIQKGADLKTATRGLDILNERDDDGNRPNLTYYEQQGWQALLDAVEAETRKPVEKHIRAVRFF